MTRRTAIWLGVAVLPAASLSAFLVYAVDNLREAAARSQ